MEKYTLDNCQVDVLKASKEEMETLIEIVKSHGVKVWERSLAMEISNNYHYFRNDSKMGFHVSIPNKKYTISYQEFVDTFKK